MLKNEVYRVNLIIMLCYLLLAVIAFNQVLGIFLPAFCVLIQSFVNLLLAMFAFFSNDRDAAKQYLLAFLLVLLVGSSTCIVNITIR